MRVTDDNFNEDDYLSSNPDVAQAVLDEKIKSGRVHFEMFGRKEGRKIKLKEVSQDHYFAIYSTVANSYMRVINYLRKRLTPTPQRHEPHLDDHGGERERIIKKYIAAGHGIEIGALQNPVQVPEGATVKYVDRMSAESLRQQYPEYKKKKLVEVDIIADGETLATIEDGSQDFVIANHFLEHCQNPILAIENMLRVLKTKGVLFIAIPDKRYSFDMARPITPYEHLLKDYTEGAQGSKRQHFQEWVRWVEKFTNDIEVERRVARLMGQDYSIHFHVWTQTEMIELMLNLKKRWEFEIELIYCINEEAIFVLRKIEGEAKSAPLTT